MLAVVRESSLDDTLLTMLILLLERAKTIEELKLDMWQTRTTLKRNAEKLYEYNWIIRNESEPYVYSINYERVK